ncbi:polysaccharide biosynthesis protein [Nocardia cyriacigeorgica]|uniref:polysaccharide biosynthesis protein n=1 Tax=Nocardia cyriacigeorgica TaxID=135487 RepID=UPI000CEA15AD|nr:polysaccharide biosynthesis protein [Nocardia cyriacigeorgica]AVH21663.1 polysaccharide biosynthesis protein [Nocardia cyriacigeorgica]MBF6321151.1 polysaccharide biosynthesis protein [Nocardia cyriacigeorgica]MBF6495154.1 polysaccharide biosynthesis protein [Nocardia cyriacigeorgica]PPJ12728.1 polysaccharide biosynthesis protein [Nocardia cyriacigeorgica]
MAGVPAVRRLPVVADLSLVTAGAMTANVAGYLLQLLAGRWLGVAGYSEFASLLAVQLLCAVPALALQNVVARELVRGASVTALRGLQWRCAVIVAAVAAALIPVVTVVLEVSPVACAAALMAAPALVMLSGEQGVLQGGRRFRGLAVVLGAAGVARVLPAIVVLALGVGAAPALWAAAAGIAGAAVFARSVAGPSSEAAVVPEHGEPPAALDGAGLDLYAPVPNAGFAGVIAVVRAAQVQAALMALSSADLIVVRIVLNEDDASRYALATMATKIAFWLPAAVGMVLYPRMAQPGHSASAIRSALAVLSGIGVLAVLGAAVAAPLAPLFAGEDYAPIQGLLWLFALHGAVLAVLQGALLSAIAVDRTALAGLTWLGLAIEVALMLAFARTIPALIITAAGVAGTTTAIVAVLVLYTAARQPAEGARS